MKISTSDFDLIMTDKHCDIVADSVALLLPITMTLEECIEWCCEENYMKFIEIIKVHRDWDTGNCEGIFSYGY